MAESKDKLVLICNEITMSTMTDETVYRVMVIGHSSWKLQPSEQFIVGPL